MQIKNMILALLIVGLVGNGFSQSYPTDQGSKILSGSLSFSNMSGDLYEDSDENSATSLMLTPSLSYFIMPGLAIGGKCLYIRNGQGDDCMTSLGIGPHVVYFIGGNKRPTSIRGTVLPYLAATFLYQRNTYKSSYENTDPWSGTTTKETYESTSTGNTIALGGGVLYMLTSSVGLSTEASYQMDSLKGEDADESTKGNKINILVGINAFIF